LFIPALPANKTLNLKIPTRDNETIGAWFVLSDPYYHSLPSIPTNVALHVSPALKEHPAILFLHGNAATRAFSARIRHYQGFSSRLGANVLAIDYRGFADSTGQPSEAGLLSDARSAFDWLVAHGKRAEDILIVGHSLGTGVAGLLGAELSSENINCRGIVLLSVGFKIIPLRSQIDDNYIYSHSQAYERYYITTTCLASFP
jgi:abhydrolase domain-containing protein 12